MKTITFSLLAVATASSLFAQMGGIGAGKGTTAVRIAGASPSSLSVTKVTVAGTITESAPILSGIQLLAIDVAGRTPLTDVVGNEAIVTTLANGTQAVELPGPLAIRIFHYVKPATHVFGFFAARGNGDVAVLLEHVGLGNNQTVDPYDPVIGASSDGVTIAIAASNPKQGVQGLGDAWLLRVDGGNLTNGQPIRELTGNAKIDVNGVGLTFFGSSLYASSHSGLLSAPSDGTGVFSILTLPPSGGLPPLEILPELVRSKDGSTLAVIAGQSESKLDIYRVDSQGAFTNVTNAPLAVVAPGYLPEVTTGPHLALSDDGSSVFYEIAFSNGNELFMQTMTPGSAPFQLTQDAEFDTSIDQMSGILTGGSFARFLAASGQLNADLYRTTLPSFGTPALNNLTKSSGAAAPWFPNAATIQVANQWNVRGARLLVDNQTAVGQGFALWVNSTQDVTGVALSSLVTQPKLFAAASGGGRVVIAAQDATTAQLLTFDGVNPAQPLLLLPPGMPVTSVAVRDGGFLAAFVVDAGAAGSFVVQASTTGAGFQIVSGSPYPKARDLLYGRNGNLMFAADAAAGLTDTYVQRSLIGAPVKVGASAKLAFFAR